MQNEAEVLSLGDAKLHDPAQATGKDGEIKTGTEDLHVSFACRLDDSAVS